MTTAAQKATAQIACEYVTNHAAEGFTQRDRLAVLEAAMDADVADFYLDCVSEEIQRAAMRAAEQAWA